jgi:hypothetical protein
MASTIRSSDQDPVDPFAGGEVFVVVEMSAEFPEGATDQVKRAVSENAKSLNLKKADWE